MAPYCRLPFRVGTVPAGSRYSYTRVRGDSAVPLYSCQCIPIMDFEPLGPNTSFIFPICPSSLALVPFCLIPSSIFHLVTSFTPCVNTVGPRVPRPITLFDTFLKGCSSLCLDDFVPLSHHPVVPINFYICVLLSISGALDLQVYFLHRPYVVPSSLIL